MKIPLSLWLLFVPVLFSVGLLFFAGPAFFSIRSAGNYAMLAGIAWASYLMSRKGYRLTPMALLLIVLIWGIVALTQIRLDRYFLLSILSRQNNSGMGGRGVVSLASEPTMYAAVMFFVLLYIWHEKRNLITHLVFFLALVQILFFARSSTISVALMIFLLGLIVYDSLKKKRFWFLGIVTLILGFGIWAGLQYGISDKLQQTRPGFLAAKIFNNPKSILTDESVHDRVAHIFFSIKGSLESGMTPHGFKAFAGYMGQQSVWKNIFPLLKPADRIMSGLGAALFETGWIGLFIVLSIFLTMLQRFPTRPAYAIFAGFIFTLTLCFSLPLGFPPIGFILGVWAAHAETNERPG